MRIITKTLAAATLALTLAAPATAGLLYDCTMKTKQANGWVSPRIVVVVDDAGKVQVIDGVILQFIEKPLAVKATQRGDKLRMTWNIANAEDASGERIPTFSYITNLNTASKAIDVSAKPVGYPQRFSRKGTCTTRTE